MSLFIDVMQSWSTTVSKQDSSRDKRHQYLLEIEKSRNNFPTVYICIHILQKILYILHILHKKNLITKNNFCYSPGWPGSLWTLG